MIRKISGYSPQHLVYKSAVMIARGELDIILIAGEETDSRNEGKAFCSKEFQELTVKMIL